MHQTVTNREQELERLRAEYEDEIDLKRAALNGTSKLMGADIERLQVELAAVKALLREALESIDSEACNEDLCTRIRAALGDEPASPRSYDQPQQP